MERDKKNGEHDRLLFDIIAGTSIGAMNGAVFVSKFLQTRSWENAAKNVIDFWTDTNKGLASNIDPSNLPLLQPWLKDDDYWYNKVASHSLI